MFRSAISLLSVFAALCLETLGADDRAAAFAGWPDGWVEAYGHFERFIAGRNATWPSSGLEISEDGTISHAVRVAKSRSESAYFYLFHHGWDILAVQVADHLGDHYSYIPGNYVAAIRVSTASGYQYIYPLVSFEIVKPPPDALLPEPGGFPFRIRVQPPPADPESAWPNERLLQFLDFHIFPRDPRLGPDHPWRIEKRNNKVAPPVTLTLDNHGHVERELVKEANAEQLLRWRIYHNGWLVRRDSAAGITRADLDVGPGTYQACVGVEGPGGFMPVSNILEFPMFPDVAGKNVVIPSDTDGDGIPDFFAAFPAGAGESATIRSDIDGDGVSAPAAAPPKDAPGTGIKKESEPDDVISASETPRNLRELWESWHIRLKIESPVTR